MYQVPWSPLTYLLRYLPRQETGFFPERDNLGLERIANFTQAIKLIIFKSPFEPLSFQNSYVKLLLKFTETFMVQENIVKKAQPAKQFNVACEVSDPQWSHVATTALALSLWKDAYANET